MDEESKREIARLNQESQEYRRRLERLEESDGRHEDDIKQLYGAQEGTKAYVSMILNKLNTMEANIYNLLGNSNNDQSANTHTERKDWIDLFKHLLTLTVGAMIAYFFTNGGK